MTSHLMESIVAVEHCLGSSQPDTVSAEMVERLRQCAVQAAAFHGSMKRTEIDTAALLVDGSVLSDTPLQRQLTSPASTGSLSSAILRQRSTQTPGTPHSRIWGAHAVSRDLSAGTLMPRASRRLDPTSVTWQP